LPKQVQDHPVCKPVIIIIKKLVTMVSKFIDALAQSGLINLARQFGKLMDDSDISKTTTMVLYILTSLVSQLTASGRVKEPTRLMTLQ
jgi:hypothetical protein